MGRDEVIIRWYGQACLSVHSPGGVTVLVDPFDESIGLRLPSVAPDVVVTTHNHYDHANVAGLRGRPKVLRGLKDDGTWNRLQETVGDVEVRAVGTYHDELRGAKRGHNAMIILDIQGFRVVHAGDLGHTLADDQVRAAGPVDVLAVPVGGIYTVGATDARRVVQQLAPGRAVIPIHFRVEGLSLRLEPVDAFLAGFARVRRLKENEARFPLAAPAPSAGGPEVLVLHWRGPEA